jgi:hypothetical protein
LDILRIGGCGCEKVNEINDRIPATSPPGCGG